MSVKTRFPPEPNGFLHLGHVKAMIMDFEHNPMSLCTLRLDDTNPDTESWDYVNAIVEDVSWLGFAWDRITYTSDYFDDLIVYAKKLITLGHAFIDMNGMEYVYDDALGLFDDMVSGKFEPKECCLRLRYSHNELINPVAYRVKKSLHYRTGDKYHAYPSYEFSHSIVDSLEEIDWSYCTLEFRSRRDLYEWVLKVLDLPVPKVYEFSRLNIHNSMLSKRKILAYKASGLIKDESDPRLLTIRGLRSRGFPAEAIKNYVRTLGSSTSNSTLSIDSLLHHIRSYYDNMPYPHLPLVIDPIEMELVSGSDRLYISRADFSPVHSSKFYRLTPERPVRLKDAGAILVYISHLELDGVVTKITCEMKMDTNTRTKAAVTWVPNLDHPIEIHLRKFFNPSSTSIGPDITRGYTIDNECNGIVHMDRVGYFDMKNNRLSEIVIHKKCVLL